VLLPYLFLNCLLFPLLFRGGPVARLLASGPARYVGKISYGLYLYHPPVYHFTGAVCRRLSWPDWWRYLVELGVVLPLAAASWRFFESRFSAMKARFNYS
jgi:peptidoglycan/LPS O-acetylase OafA/YrhL